jgi:transaldolase
MSANGTAHAILTSLEARLRDCHPLSALKVKIFADGADKGGILGLGRDPLIRGITTNPTLMKKAGISNYEGFARDILSEIVSKPVSFEVLSDDPVEMQRQALRISSWGPNVYVKIPIINTAGESMVPLIRILASEGVKLNVTALLTLRQVSEAAEALSESVPAVVSVFAGRIADTGRDPEPFMRACQCLLEAKPLTELLWASVREVLNIFQADQCGCHIVTVPHDILDKALKTSGSDLAAVSLDTVRMFATDAASAGFKL